MKINKTFYILKILVLGILFWTCSKNKLEKYNIVSDENLKTYRSNPEFINNYDQNNFKILISPNEKDRLLIGEKYREKKTYTIPITLESAFKSNSKKTDTIVVLLYQNINDIAIDWMNDSIIRIQCDTTLLAAKKDSITKIDSKKVKVIYEQNELEIKLSLLSNKVILKNHLANNKQEIKAIITYRNKSDNKLNIHRNPIFGLQNDFDNYIEAYRMNGAKEQIAIETHYQYFTDQYLDYIELLPSSEKVDTLDFGILYKFKNPGTFRLRYIDVHALGKNIYSNWEIINIE